MAASAGIPSSRGTRQAPRRRAGARVAPLYHQVYVLLRDQIVSGAVKPGHPLPSEPALAAQYDVSRVTIRKTLERLESEGLVRRVRGVGTFTDRPEAQPERADIGGLSGTLMSIENTTTAIDLSRDEVEPEGEILAAFGRGRCLRIVRVRSAEGQVMSLTTLHVPPRHKGLLSADDNPDEPVFQVLERHGIVAEWAEQTITAQLAHDLAARTLGVAEGAPLIVMRRLMLDADRAPVLHQESVYSPDRFEYRMSMARSQVGTSGRWTPLS